MNIMVMASQDGCATSSSREFRHTTVDHAKGQFVETEKSECVSGEIFGTTAWNSSGPSGVGGLVVSGWSNAVIINTNKDSRRR
jgi:hypothetical protein